MECDSNEKINAIVHELIDLLQKNDEQYWGEVLACNLNKYNGAFSKKETAVLFIKIMQGGMGSFLDLVLHKDGKPLIEENNRLDKLRHELYQECVGIWAPTA